MNQITSSLEALRADDLHSTEREFRRLHPVIWATTLFGPFLLTAILFGALWLQTGWEFSTKIAGAAALSILLLGRFSILVLGGGDGNFQDTSGLTAEHMLMLVSYLDIMTALVLAFHIGFLFRVPFIGPRALALVTDGHFILDSHPWMRKATFIGLIVFVAFPLAATGSIGGSIFGRLLGMGRFSTFIGIAIGAILGNGTMYLFSDWLGEHLDKDNIYLKIGGFAVILGLIYILERRYRQLKTEYAAQVAREEAQVAREEAEVAAREAASSLAAQEQG
jgi:hypothetical protein